MVVLLFQGATDILPEIVLVILFPLQSRLQQFSLAIGQTLTTILLLFQDFSNIDQMRVGTSAMLAEESSVQRMVWVLLPNEVNVTVLGPFGASKKIISTTLEFWVEWSRRFKPIHHIQDLLEQVNTKFMGEHLANRNWNSKVFNIPKHIAIILDWSRKVTFGEQFASCFVERARCTVLCFGFVPTKSIQSHRIRKEQTLLPLHVVFGDMS
mmetsp:Transcript_3185/g.7467  ORF Transcript_3185/g.7467 Transcript_3185/m.7467 type:complete len:210 (-) Transcript_3185:99-728(-)